jgi:hypothetical protein
MAGSAAAARARQVHRWRFNPLGVPYVTGGRSRRAAGWAGARGGPPAADRHARAWGPTAQPLPSPPPPPTRPPACLPPRARPPACLPSRADALGHRRVLPRVRQRTQRLARRLGGVDGRVRGGRGAGEAVLRAWRGRGQRGVARRGRGAGST